MDPNPKSFPILSYVLSRLPPTLSFKIPSKPSPSASASSFDIEQPPTSSAAAAAAAAEEVELVERMPHLRDPAVLAAMSSAVAEVAHVRAVLRTLGDRPDHEAVDAARVRIAEAEAEVAPRVDEEAAPAPRRPEGAEPELVGWRAVVQLEDMHEAYEALLRDAEARLDRIYSAAAEGKSIYRVGGGGGGEGEGQEEEEVNEEVVGILQGSAGKCLERVELSDRQLRHLPEAFGKLRGLVYLNVSNNQLEVIPDAIGGLDCLEELRLSSNLLVSLPDSIGLLSNLKMLDVSGNKLKALPDSISKCRSLVELDASYNELTYLPTNVGYELVNLQKLCVHLNKLRSLPTSVCEMRSLRCLDAHFNELRGLPYAIGKLINLETLNVSSNFSDLQELPITFGELISLRELDLSNNQIHALPDAFGRLEKLEKLNLDQNPLVIPPIDVVNNGLGAIMEYMKRRWAEILLENEQRSVAEENAQSQAGWLMRSTSWLNNWVTDVSGSLSGYLGTGGEKPYKDPYLDQQL